MIHDLDTVVLDVDLPESGLKRGDIGIVVLTHRDSEGYEVEFLALDGETIAVVTLFSTQIRPVGHREVPHARMMN
ncbi:hypothetical protein UR09_00560 [Candidatus Nitromaritima sp. SCGC AAA799-A02]|nr:hypothetical protein UR09_00560 [Candidatus Nitromaritima sp. SCGC AAA799-A02]